MKTILLVLISFISCSEIAQSDEIGSVVILRGAAKLFHKNKTQVIKSGSKISEGDQIETTDSSFVKLRMNDRNEIIIIENTKITIKEYKNTNSGNKVLINLSYGSIRHILFKENKQNYEVKTPNMVTNTTEATDFITVYNIKSDESILCTLNGKAYFNILNYKTKTQRPILTTSKYTVRFKKHDLKPVVRLTSKEWLDTALKKHSPAFRKIIPPRKHKT